MIRILEHHYSGTLCETKDKMWELIAQGGTTAEQAAEQAAAWYVDRELAPWPEYETDNPFIKQREIATLANLTLRFFWGEKVKKIPDYTDDEDFSLNRDDICRACPAFWNQTCT